MDLSNYHPVVQRLVDVLQEQGFWFETFEHEPVRTSEEAAQVRPGYGLSQGAKALIVRVKRSTTDKRFVMLVFPADQKFDVQKVKQHFHAVDVRFASPEELETLTQGVEPGAVPPFGFLFDLSVVADVSLFAQDKIVFNAGDRRFSVAMRSAEYRELPGVECTSIT